PLITGNGFRPVAGDELPAGRDAPPDAAEPDKGVAVLVPVPVAGDPGHELTRRPFVRRDFLNWRRRLSGGYQRWFGIEYDGFREGLVNRPAGLNFDAADKTCVE